MKSRVTKMNPDYFEGNVVSKESKSKSGALDGASSDFTADELQEFLAADYLETRADNNFKESLRKKLWDLVDERYGPKAPKPPKGD